MSSNVLLRVALEMTGSDSIGAELCLCCMRWVLFKRLHLVLCEEICPTAQECAIVGDGDALPE